MQNLKTSWPINYMLPFQNKLTQKWYNKDDQKKKNFILETQNIKIQVVSKVTTLILTQGRIPREISNVTQELEMKWLSYLMLPNKGKPENQQAT